MRMHSASLVVILMVIGVVLHIMIALTTSVEAQENDEWGVLPVADTYTDFNSDTPYGSEETLEIENWTNILEQGHIKLIWLKFSLAFLSSLPQGSVITDATIQLFCLSSYEPLNISVHSSQNNSWSESSLVYSNMPSYNVTPLDSTLVELGSKWYSWRVHDAVMQAVNNGSDVFTLVLQAGNMQEGVLPTKFISRNTKTMIWFKPLLTIYYAPPETMPPAISIISPENKTYSVKVATLTFTLSESTSWMGYSLDNQNNVTISGNTTLVGFSEGTHNITVYANDTAGNIGSSNLVYFTVDTISPHIMILSPENTTYTTLVSLAFTVNEATSWIAYSLDGHPNVTISGNTTLSGLSDGTHNLLVHAKDTIGNSGASEIIHFSIKTPQPFPIEIVGVIGLIAVIGAAFFVYFTKFRK